MIADWLSTVRGWWAERERPRAFLRFLRKRFFADKCFESAGALSFTTVFALVPLTAVVFGVIAAFPVFQTWSELLQAFVYNNFVPEAGRAVQTYLQEFADNATRMTSAGVVVLIVSAVLMMSSIEDAYNRIWRVHASRSTMARFVVYWTLLTLGPVLVVAGLAISSYLFSLPFIFETAETIKLRHYLLAATPFLVTFTAVTLSFVIVPNHSVRLRHAALGGLVATLLFELAKRGFGTYLREVPSYQQIYGALAVVPIFLIWIYLSWVVVLLGASLAASLSAFRFQPRSQRLPEGHEFVGLLRVLARLSATEGRGLDIEGLRRLEPSLSDDQLARILDRLQSLRVAERSELGDWLLVRDLDRLSLLELYLGSRLSIPLDYRPRPGGDELDGRIGGLLERLAETTRDSLDQPVALLLGLAPLQSSMSGPVDRASTRPGAP